MQSAVSIFIQLNILPRQPLRWPKVVDGAYFARERKHAGTDACMHACRARARTCGCSLPLGKLMRSPGSDLRSPDSSKPAYRKLGRANGRVLVGVSFIPSQSSPRASWAYPDKLSHLSSDC